MSELKLYNSLSRKKEAFKSIHPGFVGIYVCGPTVYGHAHLGHAKSYISFDIIVRYLRHIGYKVRYVQNITDVGHLVSDADEGEDKISKQARLEKLEPMEVVELYTRSYFEDMDVLNVLRPDISPRASGHIPEQIELIETLVDKGFAYEKDGTVYFDVSKDKNYGKLSGRNVEELMSGHRIDANTDKKHTADFALWKKADPEHIMQWNSPWGKGYPGWHLECSVMSTKYLGQPFDIHGGGLENTFPHHECEIAQSECAHDKTFANYWLHNNMITVDGTKMGKSLDNFILIKDAVKKHSALAIRFFVLSSHYRSPVDFSDKALDAAEKGLDKIYHTLLRVLDYKNLSNENDSVFQEQINLYAGKFKQDMDDDFNSPKAIATLFDFVREINAWLDKSETASATDLEAVVNIIKKTAGDVLGLLPEDLKTLRSVNDDKLESVIQVLIELRTQARSDKNFTLADDIRERLTTTGIELKDTAQGTSWDIK